MEDPFETQIVAIFAYTLRLDSMLIHRFMGDNGFWLGGGAIEVEEREGRYTNHMRLEGRTTYESKYRIYIKPICPWGCSSLHIAAPVSPLACCREPYLYSTLQAKWRIYCHAHQQGLHMRLETHYSRTYPKNQVSYDTV
jgi:hypothetical protein